MKAPRFFLRNQRKFLLLVLTGGVVAQVFNGCNPSLRDSILVGVQTSLTGLVSTFLDAFFQSLMSQSATSQPVVQAITHLLPTFA